MPRHIYITAVINSAPKGAIAWKHNDPLEDARYIFDADDLAAIRRADPSLVYELPGAGLRPRLDARIGAGR